MKFPLRTALLFILPLILYSCFEDQDDNGVFASEINDFVWKGMNAVYLYKDEVPDLANNRFSSDQEYADYLNNSGSPEQLFESLIYQRQTVDKFSWIVDDYIALEQQFSGVSRSTGLRIGLREVPGNPSNLYGFVRYVLPDSNAESMGMQRGDIFDSIDGVPLTLDNFESLLTADSFTLGLATYDNNGTAQTDDDSIIPGAGSVSLTREPYTENPVFISEVLTVDNEKVGYLMYNRFTGAFNSQLNAAFSDFAAANVQHLVLDLRYNPGGSVNSCILLASMITGQFDGEIFSTEQWNSELQASFSEQNPESLINRFTDNDDGTPLNSLNLNKVYVLTTGSSASASELLINGLDPYIDVVQIGTTTTGKYQASVTIYDSPDFGRQGANPNHTYAMQPLVLKEINAAGFTDYDNGLTPEIELEEDISNLGTLGDVSEPLLAAALEEITGNRTARPYIAPIRLVADSHDLIPHSREMYIERVLPGLIRE